MSPAYLGYVVVGLAGIIFAVMCVASCLQKYYPPHQPMVQSAAPVNAQRSVFVFVMHPNGEASVAVARMCASRHTSDASVELPMICPPDHDTGSSSFRPAGGGQTEPVAAL